jgi:hypothetical protein
VGDSFTESLQVDDDEVFSARMPGIDALNIGQSGHSAAHYVDLAPEYRARYRPQWTVIELSPPDLAEEAFDPARTHFDSELRVTRVVAQSHPGRFFSLLEPLRRYSDAVDYAIARQNAYREAARMPPLFRAADADARPKAPPVTPAAWPVAAEISHLRAAYDGRVTFFFLSPPIDAPVTPVERTFMATCSAEGLSCVNMRTTYDDFRRRGDAPFGFPNSKFGEGHMNVRGHAAAAALLATELERLRERGLF